MLNIREHKLRQYAPRTWYNATCADLTIAFVVDSASDGVALNKLAAGAKYLEIDLMMSTLDSMLCCVEEIQTRNLRYKTVNVVGNDICTFIKHGWTQSKLDKLVYNVLSEVHKFSPIVKVYSGGQTGADLAGALAGVMLSINTEVTMPEGYLQRHKDGLDYNHTLQDVREQLINGAKLLTGDLADERCLVLC
jgi:hypothetical protein